MRKNLQNVLKAFLNGEAHKGDYKNTCSTDGVTIYSYDMPIARRIFDDSVELIAVKECPSVTTRSQVHALHVYFNHYQTAITCYTVHVLSGSEPHIFKKVHR